MTGKIAIIFRKKFSLSILSLTVFILTFSFSPARAETVPGEACTPAGMFRQSAGTDTTGGFLLYCNGSQWVGFLRYSSTGVGIYTSTPGSALEVVGTVQADGLRLDSVSGNTPNVMGLGDLGNVTLTSPSNGQVLSYNGTNWVNSAGGGASAAGSNTQIQFNSGGSALGASSNFVWNNGTSTLTITGDINYTGVIVDTSDRRLKKDIANLPAGQLDKVLALQGVSFKMLSDKKGRTEMGFIAQDVQTLYPELVQENGSGMLSVNYTGMIAPLVEAIKDLKAENDALRARIEALEVRRGAGAAQ